MNDYLKEMSVHFESLTDKEKVEILQRYIHHIEGEFKVCIGGQCLDKFMEWYAMNR